MMPWELLADPTGYIFTWLLGYSGGLGSIAGVLIADYWIVRRTRAAARGSVSPDGAYRYTRAGTCRRVATLARLRGRVGAAVVPALRPIYDYAWFVGFGVSATALPVAGSPGARSVVPAAPVPGLETGTPGVRSGNQQSRCQATWQNLRDGTPMRRFVDLAPGGPRFGYASRSATIGSTRVARRAGM